jgi:hypothetical protein
MLEIGRSCEMPHCGNRHAPAHFPTQGTGSSLSASARLVTVGSKAAETTYLRSRERGDRCEASPRLPASTVVGGSGWMTCLTQVNCRRCRYPWRAKDAERLWPKGTQSVAPSENGGTRIIGLPKTFPLTFKPALNFENQPVRQVAKDFGKQPCHIQSKLILAFRCRTLNEH